MKNKGYFGDFSKKKNLFKKIIIAAIIAVLIFVPSVFIAINYFGNAYDIANNSAISVSLYDGDILLFEETAKKQEADPNGLVSIFTSILSGNQTIEAVNTSEDIPSPLTVTFKTKDVASKYFCYFFVDGSDRNFLIDEAGQYFRITETDALLFLGSIYSQVLYPTATPPALYTASNDAVTPSSVSWYYKNISQKYVHAQGIKTSDESHTYDMAGALGVDFEYAPSECRVEVFKDGALFHTATDMDLSSITVAPGTILQFKISATWNNTEDALFYGTIEYNFSAILRDRADFSVDKTSLSIGDFLILSCTNVIDTQKIEFRADPDIGFTPTYFMSGEQAFALIPFGSELTPGDYSLSLTYGASVETIRITLNDLQKSSYSVFASKTSYFAQAITNSSISEFSDIINSISNTSGEHVYVSGKFYDYKANKTPAKFAFGTQFEDSVKDNEHIFYGNVYDSVNETGHSVKAANNGRVIKCGHSEYLGNYVILDHGLGLKTIYAHLGVINVSEGDILLTGEYLGTSGSPGGSSYNAVVIISYIFDVAINYEHIAGKALPF